MLVYFTKIAKPLKSILVQSAPRRKLPLSSLLIVPFVLQLFASVGLVGFFSFQAGHRAVNDLANQLMDRTSAQVDAHLKPFLALPQQLNQLNADTIAIGQLDLNNRELSVQYLWRQIKTFKDISYIGFILPNRDEFGAGRWVGGAGLLTYNRVQNRGVDCIADEQGRCTKVLQQYDVDAQLTTDYQQPLKLKKQIWGEIYGEVYENAQTSDAAKVLKHQHPDSTDFDVYIALPARVAVYDRSRRLLGSLSVDLMLTRISEFLRDLNVSHSGQVFIVERNGKLVGSSDRNPIFRKVNHKLERISAIDSPNPMIRSVAQTLQTSFGALRSIQSDQNFSFVFNGQRQFGSVVPWRDSYGLDWLVVITVPESDFMEQIEANTRITIVLCFAALIGAIVLGIFTARLIVRPIKAINQASAAIAVGDWSQKITRSKVRELNALAQTFEQMAQQVEQSFSALAQTNEHLEERVEQRTVELQTALQELQRAQSQMIQAEKMSSLGQLVAGIAHEINNPVNFIHGNLSHVEDYAQSLLELVQLYQIEHSNPSTSLQTKLSAVDLPFLERDLSKILQSMNSGSDRIREIVLSLRSFSRLDESDIKRANVHDGIESTLLILHHRLEAANIQIVRSYAELPNIECYAGQLNQVFMNVLSNAIDALNAAEIRQIIIETSEIAPDWIEIAIADTGMGMCPTVRQRIFDPFFTTKPVGKGTGIGLSIAYQIITETHRGQLWCHSTPNVGTKFLIQIPKRQRD